MKQLINKQKETDAGHTKKPRFQITKLEERIAPRRVCDRGGCYNYKGNCHYNAHGKLVGCGPYK